MPLEVNPEPEEEVVFVSELQGPHGEKFAFAVSNQAIYLPAKKFFSKGDPWYFKRIQLSNVIEVSLRKQKPSYLYVLSIIMILLGAITTYWMMAPVLEGKGGEVKGYPIAIFVGGLVIPFIVRGRRALVVRMVNETYRWKPQLVIDSATRKKVALIQDEILEACRNVGISTINAIH